MAHPTTDGYRAAPPMPDAYRTTSVAIPAKTSAAYFETDPPISDAVLILMALIVAGLFFASRHIVRRGW